MLRHSDQFPSLPAALSRSCWRVAVVVGGISVLALSAASSSFAQTPPAPSPQPAAAAKAKAAPRVATKPRDPVAAQTAIEQGEKLLESNKPDQAISTLSSAISGGNLPSTVMARALYLRGIAHRRLQKPAQAISDLTSSLWLKSGLNDQDRADAIKQRSAAYAEAGLADPSGQTFEAKPATRTPSAPVAAAAPAPSATPPPVAKVSTTTAAATPASAVIAAATTTAPATADKPQWTGRGGKRIEPPTPPPNEGGVSFAPATAAAAATEPSTPPLGGGNFFGSLFGGQASTATAPTPAAAVPPPLPAASEPAPQAAAATKAATRKTPVKLAAGAPSPTGAAASPQQGPKQAPGAVPAAAGSFRARVALVRTEAEAQAVVTRLKTQHAAVVSTHPATVDQTQFGNMGAFFQVRVGPYNSARDAQSACEKLKGSGLDCVPVNN